jgi:exopolyphosphatase / guanosine-5'-triphosphate,3'-diphosphate pyrophosphatase
MDVGVIDVGSNSVRLLLATVRGGGLVPLAEERVRLGLGEDVEQHGGVSRAKLAKAARAVREYARLSRAHGVERLEVIVTAPGRQSANASELVRALAAAAAAHVRVLSAEDEGRFAYEGAAAALPRLPKTLAVCDVGGGSTEIVAGVRSSGPVWLRSFDLGAVRLTRRLLTGDPPGEKALGRARAEIDRTLAGAVPPLCERALAAGGTPRALRRVVGRTLGREQLDEALRAVVSQPARAVASRFGIDRRRARLLPAGILILAAIQERLVVPLEVSPSGLREGVALALLAEAAAA